MTRSQVYITYADARNAAVFPAPPDDATLERFWKKVNRNGPIPPYAPALGPCWLWTGAVDAAGYGRCGGRPRPMGSNFPHRVTYMLAVGPVPDGLELDHLCRVRNCCNPAHLEAVTHRENVLRGKTVPAMHAAKTHCHEGHEFTPENTYARSDWPGGRGCKACNRRRQREFKERKARA